MKTLVLFLAFAVAFVCGMYAEVALQQRRAMSHEKSRIELMNNILEADRQADLIEGAQW